MPRTTATVETLTAEVRVLMVGTRQVTLSIFGQLDDVAIDKIEPFGRVSPKDADPSYTYAVGRHTDTGELVRCQVLTSRSIMEKILHEEKTAIENLRQNAETYHSLSGRKHAEGRVDGYSGSRMWEAKAQEAEGEADERQVKMEALAVQMEIDAVRWENLPLIVLAGLR